jgi:hypothetical protein
VQRDVTAALAAREHCCIYETHDFSLERLFLVELWLATQTHVPALGYRAHVRAALHQNLSYGFLQTNRCPHGVF